MDKNEICLKTRKQLLFVQCFPLFWSPVFPCFACTVNMRLGSCCSVGENSCKSWQEVGKNTRVSLFHCFFSSPAQSFSISWMTQSLFSLHALELYFVPLPIIVHEPTIVPPFLQVPSFLICSTIYFPLPPWKIRVELELVRCQISLKVIKEKINFLQK